MKIYRIFNEYLSSKQFENEIDNLLKQDETDKYIKDFINIASNLNNFFSN